MLTLRAFGPAGQSLPLPQWTHDRERFLRWATAPVRERDSQWPPFHARPASLEDWKRHASHHEATHDQASPFLAWATLVEGGYAFGWADNRVTLRLIPGTGPRLSVDVWVSQYWNSTYGIFAQQILQELLAVFGLNNPHPDGFFNGHASNQTVYGEAPWLTDTLRFFKPYNTHYREARNLEVHSPLEKGVHPQQRAAFVRWLVASLRQVGRHHPLLRLAWRAARAAQHHTPITVTHLMSLWQTFEAHPEVLQYPSVAFFHALKSSSCVGTISSASFEIHRRKWDELAYLWEESSYTRQPDVLAPLHAGFYPKREALAVSAQMRWTAAVWKKLEASKGKLVCGTFPTHPRVLLELLLANNQPIPCAEKIHALLASPYPFWAWLLHHTPWAQLPAGTCWKDEAIYSEITGSEEGSAFLKKMTAYRRLYDSNPEHFQAMAMAAMAWVRDVCRPAKGQDSSLFEEQRQFLERLNAASIPSKVFKERLNKRTTWKGVEALMRHLEREKLKACEDTSAPVLPLEGFDGPDEPWPSLLGHLRFPGFSIHPLCRPSHLHMMGEFLGNCAQKDNLLSDFTEESLENSSRFFRLSGDHQEFLLQLSHTPGKSSEGQAWRVKEVRGRSNHPATTEAADVAQQVCQLYNVLEAAQAGIVLANPCLNTSTGSSPCPSP